MSFLSCLSANGGVKTPSSIGSCLSINKSLLPISSVTASPETIKTVRNKGFVFSDYHPNACEAEFQTHWYIFSKKLINLKQIKNESEMKTILVMYKAALESLSAELKISDQGKRFYLFKMKIVDNISCNNELSDKVEKALKYYKKKMPEHDITLNLIEINTIMTARKLQESILFESHNRTEPSNGYQGSQKERLRFWTANLDRLYNKYVVNEERAELKVLVTHILNFDRYAFFNVDGIITKENLNFHYGYKMACYIDKCFLDRANKLGPNLSNKVVQNKIKEIMSLTFLQGNVNGRNQAEVINFISNCLTGVFDRARDGYCSKEIMMLKSEATDNSFISERNAVLDCFVDKANKSLFDPLCYSEGMLFSLDLITRLCDKLFVQVQNDDLGELIGSDSLTLYKKYNEIKKLAEMPETSL